MPIQENYSCNTFTKHTATKLVHQGALQTFSSAVAFPYYVASPIHTQEQKYQRTNLSKKEDKSLAQQETRNKEWHNSTVTGMSPGNRYTFLFLLEGKELSIKSMGFSLFLGKMHPSQGYLFSSCAQLPQAEPGTQHTRSCTKTHPTLPHKTFRKFLLKIKHMNRRE